jgi:hypothetical protein
LTLPTTKADGVQYVRQNEEAERLLQSLIPGNKSMCVFPSQNPATHADPRNFYRRHYQPTVNELRLTGVTWQTFASRLAITGVTEVTIASLHRHSCTALVRRYAHLSPSYSQEAIEKVSRFGKAEATAPAKQEPETKKQGEAPGAFSPPIATGPGTGKVVQAL